MSKDLKYTSKEMYTLVISNVEYLLEKEKRFLQDNEVQVRNLQSHIELSKKKIEDFQKTVNVFKSHPGITWDIQS
jgi:hypothetical protein